VHDRGLHPHLQIFMTLLIGSTCFVENVISKKKETCQHFVVIILSQACVHEYVFFSHRGRTETADLLGLRARLETLFEEFIFKSPGCFIPLLGGALACQYTTSEI